MKKTDMYHEIKKIEAERDLYKKVLIQIATQKRGSLSRRLALSVVHLAEEIKNEQNGNLSKEEINSNKCTCIKLPFTLSYGCPVHNQQR